jgi:hypothetical protein
VFPFALWALFASLGYLSAPRQAIYALSVALPIMGFYIDVRILTRPEELSRGENHISWKLIYLMAIFAYAGLALIYAWPLSG